MAAVVSHVGGGPSLAAFGVAVAVIIVADAPSLALSAVVVRFRQNGVSVRAAWQYGLTIGSGLSLLFAVVILVAPVSSFALMRVMGLNEGIATLTRMALWGLAVAPFAVAWRKTGQGLLIADQDTRPIGVAAVWRLGVSMAGVVSLAAAGVPAPLAGGAALSLGALTEGFWIWRAAVRRRLSPVEDAPLPRARAIGAFHAPVAGVILLSVLPQPLIASAIARTPVAGDALAAWVVVYGLVYLVNGSVEETESVTQALGTAGEALARRFCVLLGVGMTCAWLCLSVLGPAQFYIETAMGLTNLAGTMALGALWPTFALPIVLALRGWLRGRALLADRPAINATAMAVNVAVVAGLLALVVPSGTAAAVTGGTVCLTVGLMTETGILLGMAVRSLKASRSVEVTGT